MATQVDICNLALSRVGVKAYISSIDEDSPQAKACKTIYEMIRDLVLTEHEWAFAEQTALLASLTNTSLEWGYAYQMPTDCLKARYLAVGVRNLPVDLRPSYHVSGTTLYTDQSVAQLVYTRQVTQEGLFMPYFTEAFAWRMAVELTASMSVKPPLDVMKLYQISLNNGIAQDLQSQQPDVLPDAEHIRVRG